MNRRELVLAIAERADLDRKTADAAVAAFVDVVTDTVASGDPVAITGFAKFNRKVRPAGLYRNNFTGEMVKQPEKKTVRITPLKAFKDTVLSGKATKKAPAKKAAAKKAVAKKAPAKKAAAKKAPAKKAVAKKR